MNWILLILGIPCGLLTYIFGEKLLKKAKVKNSYLQGLIQGVPLLIFVSLVIIADNLL